MNLSRLSLLLAASLLPATLQEAHAVTIDWVTVGDPGNTADTAPAGYGAVADSFQIMKYEFTNQQYTAFLNSVAATDPYSLYNASMGSNARGGITQSGTSGAYTYAVKSSMGDKPVNYVTWWDAARVSNWYQNGATSSASTETGAYTLNGAFSGDAPAVNPGATFYIPTEDQWYKAAYYKGGSTNAGYWDYATQSDTTPTLVTAGSTGIGSAGSTGNSANYDNTASWNGQTGNVTTVGTNGGASAYGAFDMSGNAFEWNDLTGVAGSSRWLRGGGWDAPAFDLSSSNRGAFVPAFESIGNLGFRLAAPVAVPEPSTWAMGLAGIACGGWHVFRTRRRRTASGMGRSFIASLLVMCSFMVGSTRAAPITIDFETISGVTPSAAYNVGDFVPTTARLSTQLLGTHGVRFASLHQPYVGLLEIGVGHAASGKNSIGAVGLSNTVNFSDDIVVSFFDPQDGTTQAVTDYVSIRCDNSPTFPGPLRLEAYGVAGTLLSSDSQTDGAGVLLSVSTPNIHYVRVMGDGSSAFDDLTFNAPVAVPEPSTWVLGLAGIACGGWHVSRTRRRRTAYGVRRSLVDLLLVTCSLMAGLVQADTIMMDMVTVGDPGNADDTTGYGSVGYEYQIGKYEVTIGQYTEFLNAVAATDTYSLYSPTTGTDLRVAGIGQSGTSGSYIYSVIAPSGTTPLGATSPGSRPIACVNWWDCARFANWMSNGQPTGAQTNATTENGAYFVNGSTSGTFCPAKNVVNPNTNAAPTFYIPTENEWYKAAYYNPLLNSGSGGYYAYATQSDVAPGNSLGGSANQANYYTGAGYSVTQQSGTAVRSQNYLSEAGAFSGSGSFYGTFDQSGNLYEYNDLTGAAGARGQRGGGWMGEAVSSRNRLVNISTAVFTQLSGFRLAAPVAVPEPSANAMALAALACGGYSMFRRRRAR